MEKKNNQCPNCHAFKIVNKSTKLFGTIVLGFLFDTILLPLFGLGLVLWGAAIIALIQLPFARGNVSCKGCGWQGVKGELINSLQSI
jgi:hypothetical protein